MTAFLLGAFEMSIILIDSTLVSTTCDLQLATHNLNRNMAEKVTKNKIPNLVIRCVTVNCLYIFI